MIRNSNVQIQTQNQKQHLHKSWHAQHSTAQREASPESRCFWWALRSSKQTAISSLQAEIRPKNCRGTPLVETGPFLSLQNLTDAFLKCLLRSLHFKLVFEFCSRKSALEFSSYPPSCPTHLQGKPWDPWGPCPVQKFSSPAVLERTWGISTGRAGRLRPWKSPPSIVSFAAQSPPPALPASPLSTPRTHTQGTFLLIMLCQSLCRTVISAPQPPK